MVETTVQQFYKNKNIFLTGGTGFLGKVLIEKILRSTEVELIYVLVRAKDGQPGAERIREMFASPLFEELRKLKANAQNRIAFIHGDCALPNLGLSPRDRQMLIENVDVVVHAAATVRFNEPLYNALIVNVRATRDLIQMASKMRRLQAFVHVSSAFANCTERHIDEQFYVPSPDLNAEKLLQLADLVRPDMLNRHASEFINKFPNTYTYTKALAEAMLKSAGEELPLCIFRPGIIVSTLSEPVPGWIDNLYGPVGVIYGVLRGVQRVTYYDDASKAHLVPVDFCANAILVCGWQTACEAAKATPRIYNFVADARDTISWNDFRLAVVRSAQLAPLTTTWRCPFLRHTNSKLVFKLMCFWHHTLPAHVGDVVLLLLGRKRRMVKMCRRMHCFLAVLEYFTENSWTFSVQQTRHLWAALSDNDRRLFNFDMSTIDWSQYLDVVVRGVRHHVAQEEPRTIPKAQRRIKKLQIAHWTVEFLIYSGITASVFMWVRSIFQH